MSQMNEYQQRVLQIQIAMNILRETCTGILQKSYPGKFRKIHRKTPVCNFNKKETPAKVFQYTFCEFFQNSFFIEHLRRAVSSNYR